MEPAEACYQKYCNYIFIIPEKSLLYSSSYLKVYFLYFQPIRLLFKMMNVHHLGYIRATAGVPFSRSGHTGTRLISDSLRMERAIPWTPSGYAIKAMLRIHGRDRLFIFIQSSTIRLKNTYIFRSSH